MDGEFDDSMNLIKFFMNGSLDKSYGGGLQKIKKYSRNNVTSFTFNFSFAGSSDLGRWSFGFGDRNFARSFKEKRP